MNKNVKILDCTFRDGGYYNDWDFESDLVGKYLHAVNNANIDIIELGFRNFPKDKFLGAFAYTTDKYINTLNISDSMFIGVMIDAAEIINSNFSIKKSINFLFQEKRKSRVGLVRIATHFDTIDQCYEIAKLLKIMGYKVGINLMQPNTQTNTSLSKVAKLVENWQLVDVLYFADSLGGMEAKDIIRVASSLRLNWSGDIGLHAHNNKGLAVSNTLVAIENGVSWVDCTVLGMGRGAGNAQTENLLIELQEKYQFNYIADALFDLVLSNFSPLKERYQWGSSLLYNLASINNIHPTYIQEMIMDNRYNIKEILQAIDFMSTLDASHFDENLLLNARGDISNEGSWSAKAWCQDKEVLILGSGIDLQTYKQGIIQYIDNFNPVVMSLNVKHDFPENLINVYVSSNESKMLSEHEMYSTLNKPLAVSKVLLNKVTGKSLNIKELWDYGLNIKKNTFTIDEKECSLPYELSIGYALSLANIGGANNISLVGFNGYNKNDIRQIKMDELFKLYNRSGLVPVLALTPTNYQLEQGSIYAEKY